MYLFSGGGEKICEKREKRCERIEYCVAVATSTPTRNSNEKEVLERQRNNKTEEKQSEKRNETRTRLFCSAGRNDRLSRTFIATNYLIFCGRFEKTHEIGRKIGGKDRNRTKIERK